MRTVANGCERLRTVANGCERLRTVANGCEQLRNVWRTQLNPHTPRVKREPLLRIREKRIKTMLLLGRGASAVCGWQDSSFHGGRRNTPRAVKSGDIDMLWYLDLVEFSNEHVFWPTCHNIKILWMRTHKECLTCTRLHRNRKVSSTSLFQICAIISVNCLANANCKAVQRRNDSDLAASESFSLLSSRDWTQTAEVQNSY